jgi:hypothetical protein
LFSEDVSIAGTQMAGMAPAGTGAGIVCGRAGVGVAGKGTAAGGIASVAPH